jgi:MFS family permease
MFIVLALITMIGSFTTEIYLPTLNDLACHIYVPMSSISFIITIFFMAYGVSQLVIGILMNRYGRRSILLVGVFLYLIGAILAYETILIDRVFQGIGVASVAVAGIVIIRDTTIMKAHQNRLF